MDKIILVNKEKGITSRDVVNDLVHIFNIKKIGHTGTLDPIATGVLVCTIGKCTKLNLDLTNEYKEYIATFKLGISTDTLDITGNILSEEEVNVAEDEVKKAILSFKGSYMQEVPLYSSVKVNGKKLYEYGRCGAYVQVPSREVEIKEIEYLGKEEDTFKFKCLVSKGTYIRSLIRDIGSSLNTYAVMTDLVRTKQGKFRIEDSYKIEDIKNGNFKLLDISDVLEVEKVECDETLYKQVCNGVKQDVKCAKNYILYTYQEQYVCLYKKVDEYYRMYLKLD